MVKRPPSPFLAFAPPYLEQNKQMHISLNDLTIPFLLWKPADGRVFDGAFALDTETNGTQSAVTLYSMAGW